MTGTTLIHCNQIQDAVGNTIVVRGERIVAVQARAIRDPFDEAPGWMLRPGFVDLQVNGGGGVLFNDAVDDHARGAEALRAISEAHARCGTTTILPTLISGSRAQIRAARDVVAGAIAAGMPGIAGLHVEGPFISPARPGIHPPEAITTLTDDDVAMLSDPFPGVLLLTLAPECVTERRLTALVQAGVFVFAGHTDCSVEQALAALQTGMRGFTHLYNAMSQLGSRAPGAVGAALSSGAYAGIIADGHHVHTVSIETAFRAIGEDRLFLVSDAMPTAGSTITSFHLGEREIHLRDGRLTDSAGTLAGAHLTLSGAVQFLEKSTKVGSTRAWRMASRTPAEAVGLHDRGHVASGSRADLVAWGFGGVEAVWQGGARVTARPG